MTDLMKLQDTAYVENEKGTDGPYNGLTQKQVEALAEATVDTFEKSCHNAIAVMALLEECCNRLGFWHYNSGLRMAEAEEAEISAAWSRDAGKFQAVGNILSTISCGDGDFTFGKDPSES